MRFLLISCFALLLFSCGSYPKKQDFNALPVTKSTVINPYFSNQKKDYVYKASINVYNNNFGGLLIIKKIDNAHTRVVFTTEMGNKLFDFSYINDDFKVNYCLKKLNKKILINILRKDFRALIKENNTVIEQFSKENRTLYKTTIYGNKYYYYETNTLNSIVREGNGKEKVIITFDDVKNNHSNKILIKHNNIKLNINLKSIN
ncbi:hypothetical protein [Seonamhaeicola marinus]|uniref:DUF4292 domain-containing protein n=1 Tax=Seonamhaeicola marinus TaxID=1912246 RepID=A0A5D0HSM5_9FLAO|nr:hypothetical protein [Seonamhaeicola marinus]TYA73960.1 hypothetical protein FUA24_11460 [Seonamhaeicola marinus]